MALEIASAVVDVAVRAHPVVVDLLGIAAIAVRVHKDAAMGRARVRVMAAGQISGREDQGQLRAVPANVAEVHARIEGGVVRVEASIRTASAVNRRHLCLKSVCR